MTENTAIASQIVDFIAFSEQLKKEMRHSYLSNGRQESVADHSWQMALMALLSYRYVSKPVDILRVLKMIAIHDLAEAEAEAGDVSHLDQLRDPAIRELKIQREKAAIEKIKQALPSPICDEVYTLWYEYEDRVTNEAVFVKALDDMEVQIQHNLAPIETWEEKEFDLSFTKTDRHCKHDPFLMKMADAIVRNTVQKLTYAGMDVDSIRKRACA